MARDVSVRVPAALLPVEIFRPGRLFGMPLVPAARAVAVPGDLGFLDAPRELGAPLTLPRSQYDRASWSDPSLLQEFLAFPAEGRGSWDAWGWDLVASEPLPINPLGTGGGKSPSPHRGRIWGGARVGSGLSSLHLPPAAVILEQLPACRVQWPS